MLHVISRCFSDGQNQTDLRNEVKDCQWSCIKTDQSAEMVHFLADRTNGRAYATVLRPSVVV